MNFVRFAVAGFAAAFILSAASWPAAAQDKPAVAGGNFPKTEAFLRKEFRNPAIVLKQKDDKTAGVFVGDKPAGTLTFDSGAYDWEFTIPPAALAENGAPDPKKAVAFLQALLGGKDIKLDRSNERSAGISLSEFLTADVTVLKETGAGSFNTIFLDDDVQDVAQQPGASRSAAIQFEPVDPAKSTFHARVRDVKVFDEPNAGGKPSITLSEGQQVKVTGKTKSYSDGWYRLDDVDGKARYVSSEDLVDESTHRRRQRYKMLADKFPLIVSQTGASSGPLAPFMGFYTGGIECMLRPVQARAIPGLEKSQRLDQSINDLLWSGTSWALWSDGTHLFRADVDSGEADRFKFSFIRKVTFKDHGEVQIWRLERVEPAGFDRDLSVVGFTEKGKLLLAVEIDGTSYKWPHSATRCPSSGSAKEATARFYKTWLARLAGQSTEDALGPAAKLLPLDAAVNARFFVRADGAVLRATADNNGKFVADLKEGDEVKLVGGYPVDLGESWNERRWWKIETKSGASGFILGRHLIGEESQKEKQRLIGNVALLYSATGKPPYAKGPHVGLAGIVAPGGCEKQAEPERIGMESTLDEGATRAQVNANNRWLNRMTFIWFEGNLLNRISLLEPGIVRQYRITPFKMVDLETMRKVRFFKTVQTNGPPEAGDDDWSIVGFNDDRDILTRVVIEGRDYRYLRKLRCLNSTVMALQDKAVEVYKKNIGMLPMAREPLRFVSSN